MKNAALALAIILTGATLNGCHKEEPEPWQPSKEVTEYRQRIINHFDSMDAKMDRIAEKLKKVEEMTRNLNETHLE